MMPFDSYPGAGRELLGKCGITNCRHEYGLKLQRLTGQTSCAYCSLSLVDTYEHWLLMSVDHVIPTATGVSIGLKKEWLEDFCNTVLCCSACNGFKNRFELDPETSVATNFVSFVALRDAAFATRKELILVCHRNEREFYNNQPWKQRLVSGVAL